MSGRCVAWRGSFRGGCSNELNQRRGLWGCGAHGRLVDGGVRGEAVPTEVSVSVIAPMTSNAAYTIFTAGGMCGHVTRACIGALCCCVIARPVSRPMPTIWTLIREDCAKGGHGRTSRRPQVAPSLPRRTNLPAGVNSVGGDFRLRDVTAAVGAMIRITGMESLVAANAAPAQ